MASGVKHRSRRPRRAPQNLRDSRMPIGTPHVSTTAPQPHIRVVPRADRDSAEAAESSGTFEDHDYLPTYRTPSLQFSATRGSAPAAASHQTPGGPRPSTESSAKTSFADMTRRPGQVGRVESLRGSGRAQPPLGSPSPLTNPNGSQRLSHWRPLPPDESEDTQTETNKGNARDNLRSPRAPEATEDGNSPPPFVSFTVTQSTSRKDASAEAFRSGPPYSVAPVVLSSAGNNSAYSRAPDSEFAVRASPEALSPRSTQRRAHADDHVADAPEPTPTMIPSQEPSLDENPSSITAKYDHVFGKRLPDPIHLDQLVGAFDGQVTFIAHPNRDVTAHQWDKTSFEWRNIGLYSHARQRIEGQIAAAELRGSSIPHNTIEHFKARVEQRETQSQAGKYAKCAPPTRPGFRSNPDHYASLSSLSPSSTGYQPDLGRKDPRYDEEPETVVTQSLEDPFVTPARSAQPSVPRQLQFGNELRPEPGSMDLDYQFPPQPHVHTTRNVYAFQEPGRLAAPRNNLTPLEFGTPLGHDNAFEQDYLSGARTPARPTVAHGRHVLQPSPVVDRLSIPHTHMTQLATRRVPVLQGPTVANPNRIASTLNANAQPYTRACPVSGAQEEHKSENETSLKYSDPDNTARVAPTHEIINGLSQQAPTPQNFKGPFFTDDIPTTRNPTTARTVQIEEAAKLHKWFHDGENPARRQDFTRRLMASAMLPTGRTNNTRNVGTIGEPRVSDPTRFDNTPAFVRLYEVLSEYRMETRGEKQREYFTRKWKVAEPRLRDLTPGGNDSFFDTTCAGLLARPGPLQPAADVGRAPYLIPQVRRQRF